MKNDKKDILIVIDMQNDFIDGALANKDAQAIVDPICDLIRSGGYDKVYYTRDTHGPDYLETQEGKILPVIHCIKGTRGWCVNEKIMHALIDSGNFENSIDKPTFGYTYWESELYDDDIESDLGSITLVGTCTDICVVSNALILKALYPEIPVKVISSLCAGVTKEKHEAALETMRSCQVVVSK